VKASVKDFVKDFLKVKLYYIHLFSFIHACKLEGLELPLRKPCWFILLIMNLLRWLVIQSLTTNANLFIWNVKVQRGLATPWGPGTAGGTCGGAGRAEASPARAHPATPAREQGRLRGKAAGGGPETRSPKMSILTRQV